MKTLYIIDAYSVLYRAYYIAPPLTNPAGKPIGAAYIYLKMILKLLQQHKPNFAVVAYDHASTTLRKQKYPTYKGNRSKTTDLYPQFQIARDASQALGLMNIEAKGYEADDIIATIIRRVRGQDVNVVIVSPDKDLMQLVEDGFVTAYDPMREKYYQQKDVFEKFGVVPSKLLDALSLTGDVSDNVPGIPKVGMKTAARLVNEWGNLEEVLRNADQIPQKACRESILKHSHLALQAKDLISLYNNAPVHAELEDMGIIFNRETVRDFCDLHGFKSISEKI